MMSFKRTLMGFAVAGAILASTSAAAFPEFTVNANGLQAGDAGTVNPFVADKIIGNYFEVITFTSATTFSVSLLFQAGSFVNTNTARVYTGTETGLTNTYGIYALFTGSGTFGTSGGTTTFNLSSGTLDAYYDNSNNTLFTAPLTGATPWTVNAGTGGDDIHIATGTETAGTGTLTCNVGNNCGSFGQTTTFTLLNGASNFFILPVPFYNLSLQNGQFNGFPVGAGTTVTLNGSADVEFARS